MAPLAWGLCFIFSQDLHQFILLEFPVAPVPADSPAGAARTAGSDTHGGFSLPQIGWMMWNWLVSALATGASVVLYDGSPLIPSPNVLWDLTDRLGYVCRVKSRVNGIAAVTVTQTTSLEIPLARELMHSMAQFIFWLSLGCGTAFTNLY